MVTMSRKSSVPQDTKSVTRALTPNSQGKKRYPLVFLYWLKRGVRVKPSFGFKGTTGSTVTRTCGDNFVAALERALAAAKK
jgi:hypothetical protein